VGYYIQSIFLDLNTPSSDLKRSFQQTRSWNTKPLSHSSTMNTVASVPNIFKMRMEMEAV